MRRTLIRNAQVVNAGRLFKADVLIEADRIAKVEPNGIGGVEGAEEIDAEGKLMLPGAIDDQVHFREPGLTHKENITSGARAAVAGGITSFMEMPNTVPAATTQQLLEQKYAIAKQGSVANYSFFMGAANDNLEEVLRTDTSRVCGVKAFLGSSTGNMLVDDEQVLNELFKECPALIAVHCEDEATIRQNMAEAKAKWGDDIPMEQHPLIRSEEACYLSSSRAVALAKKHGTRLHVLHISTAKELELFDEGPLENKRVTAEACIHHLWLTDAAYAEKGSLVKWNPAIKKESDREAIVGALSTGRIDVVATDHAPHTLQEKANPYTSCPSGGPMVQHALPVMLEYWHQGKLPLELIVEKMCHAPARLFNIKDRGYINEGHFADLVLVDPKQEWTVQRNNVMYKCGWSPLEGTSLRSTVTHTFVNGHLAYRNGQVNDSVKGSRMLFER